MKLPVIVRASNEKGTIAVILQRVPAFKLEEINGEGIGVEDEDF